MDIVSRVVAEIVDSYLGLFIIAPPKDRILISTQGTCKMRDVEVRPDVLDVLSSMLSLPRYVERRARRHAG
jgi:hypothetical protein